MRVLFSTRNGMPTLPRMFSALSRLRPPKEGFELHVADNGSSDATAEYLASWRDRLPLHIHKAPEPGKNVALNLMIDKLVGTFGAKELIVLTDDDVLPDPSWLVALEQASRSGGYDVFTGPIMPVWPGPVPDWMPGLKRYYDVLFTVTSREPGPCQCIDAWGPNMAVRGAVFQNGIRFNSSFGPDGTQRFPMGSETELMRRLDRLGHKALFVGTASVGHMLRDEVFSRTFIRARAFRAGLGCGLMGRNESFKGDRQLLFLGLSNMAGAVLRWPVADDPERARREFQWHWGSGALTALMRSATGSPASMVPVAAKSAEPLGVD